MALNSGETEVYFDENPMLLDVRLPFESNDHLHAFLPPTKTKLAPPAPFTLSDDEEDQQSSGTNQASSGTLLRLSSDSHHTPVPKRRKAIRSPHSPSGCEVESCFIQKKTHLDDIFFSDTISLSAQMDDDDLYPYPHQQHGVSHTVSPWYNSTLFSSSYASTSGAFYPQATVTARPEPLAPGVVIGVPCSVPIPTGAATLPTLYGWPARAPHGAITAVHHAVGVQQDLPVKMPPTSEVNAVLKDVLEGKLPSLPIGLRLDKESIVAEMNQKKGT